MTAEARPFESTGYTALLTINIGYRLNFNFLISGFLDPIFYFPFPISWILKCFPPPKIVSICWLNEPLFEAHVGQRGPSQKWPGKACAKGEDARAVGLMFPEARARNLQ